MNATRRLLLVAGLSGLLIPAGGAWANGTPFFFPNPRGNANNPNALVYAGNIKDTSGRYVDDVQVLVIATDLGMTIPVRNDAPGHYRTPAGGTVGEGRLAPGHLVQPRRPVGVL